MAQKPCGRVKTRSHIRFCSDPTRQEIYFLICGIKKRIHLQSCWSAWLQQWSRGDIMLQRWPEPEPVSLLSAEFSQSWPGFKPSTTSSTSLSHLTLSWKLPRVNGWISLVWTLLETSGIKWEHNSTNTEQRSGCFYTFNAESSIKSTNQSCCRCRQTSNVIFAAAAAPPSPPVHHTSHLTHQ